MKTSFYIGKDLKTGEIFAEEYGKQIKGQMSIDDYSKNAAAQNVQHVNGDVVDTETCEVLNETVVDFRKVGSC